MGCISPGGAGGLPVRRKYTSFFFFSPLMLQMLALTFVHGERMPFGSLQSSCQGWFLPAGLSEAAGEAAVCASVLTR